MDFKVSSYIAFSKKPNELSSDKQKGVIFSTRTGRGLLATNYLIKIISTGEIGEIPSNIFLRLCGLEILVPKDEDELRVIVERKVASYLDLKRNHYYVNYDAFEGSDFYENLRSSVKLRELNTIDIILNIGNHYSLNEKNVQAIKHRLDWIGQQLNLNCSLRLSLDFSTTSCDLFKILLQNHVTSFEIKLRIEELNGEEKLENILLLAKQNEASIVFRLFPGLSDSDKVLSFLYRICNNQKFSVLFSRNELLPREKFAELEIIWLAKMKELGISGHFLPTLTPGTTSIQKSNFGLVANENPLDLWRLFENEFLVPNIVFNEPAKQLKDVPCCSCSLLPLCGGTNKKTWNLYGKNICPSFLENLMDRVNLFYSI